MILALLSGITKADWYWNRNKVTNVKTLSTMFHTKSKTLTKLINFLFLDSSLTISIEELSIVSPKELLYSLEFMVVNFVMAPLLPIALLF